MCRSLATFLNFTLFSSPRGPGLKVINSEGAGCWSGYPSLRSLLVVWVLPHHYCVSTLPLCAAPLLGPGQVHSSGRWPAVT